MFYWVFAGRNISHGGKYMLTNGNKTLRVSSLVYNDRGRYTCVAYNHLGNARTSATLTVHGKMPLHSFCLFLWVRQWHWLGRQWLKYSPVGRSFSWEVVFWRLDCFDGSGRRSWVGLCCGMLSPPITLFVASALIEFAKRKEAKFKFLQNHMLLDVCIFTRYKCSSPRLPKATSTPSAGCAPGANNALTNKYQDIEQSKSRGQTTKRLRS